MNNLTINDRLLADSVLSDVPEMPEHKFSLSYKHQRKKIIGGDVQSVPASKSRFRMKYLIIAAIIASVAILAGFGFTTLFRDFIVTEYDTYSSMIYRTEFPDAPKTIEKKFYLDMDMSDCEVSVICDDQISYFLQYRSADSVMSIEQMVHTTGLGMHLNTENAMVMPTEVTVNGWTGMYFQNFQGTNCYVLNTGEYLLTYVSNIEKDELEKIICATKFE